MQPILEGVEGRYRILRRLSTGGAAEIFLAENLAANPHRHPFVAVKRLRSADERTVAASLVDEARLIARLDHPNIARALDLADGPPGLCLVLECLHGEDVRQILREVRRTSQRLPFGLAVRIAADVAAGLHHAHRRAASDGTPLAVVHRDVTPDNILVTYGGDVKLLDFGIAKWIGATEQTQLGFVKGKAPYLSPEQCVQGGVDGRSDVFSMGAVIYEMTTLRAPFGDTLGDDAGIMQRIVDGRYPPPGTIVDDYPPELAAIVTRCLSPARELRYQDAEELRCELATLMGRREWATSASDLARYLRTLFGERTPPWLDDPPTRIAALERPVSIPGEDEATVIGPPPLRLIALAGGEAPPEPITVGDTMRMNLPAAPPGDDTTTVTEWPPRPPRVSRPRVVAAEPRDDRPWIPIPVAVAFAFTTLVVLILATRCVG